MPCNSPCAFAPKPMIDWVSAMSISAMRARMSSATGGGAASRLITSPPGSGRTVAVTFSTSARAVAAWERIVSVIGASRGQGCDAGIAASHVGPGPSRRCRRLRS